jgi:hypothetical protein
MLKDSFGQVPGPRTAAQSVVCVEFGVERIPPTLEEEFVSVEKLLASPPFGMEACRFIVGEARGYDPILIHGVLQSSKRDV